jgi:hypothetical protein
MGLMREVLIMTYYDKIDSYDKIEIEVEWPASEFDVFIGQPKTRFFYEQIHSFLFTSDFKVARNSTSTQYVYFNIIRPENSPFGAITTTREQVPLKDVLSQAGMFRVLHELKMVDYNTFAAA